MVGLICRQLLSYQVYQPSILPLDSLYNELVIMHVDCIFVHLITLRYNLGDLSNLQERVLTTWMP